MIAESSTNSIYFSEYLKTDVSFAKTHEHIVLTLSELGIIPKYLRGTNDIWVRDFMPIQVSVTQFIEYRYDPDYLQGNAQKLNTRELKSYPDIVCDLHNIRTEKSDIILDGGNLIKSESSIILTDKIFGENRLRYTQKQLTAKLYEIFEVEQVIIIPWDNDCVFGYADGMLRFVDNTTVLISGFYAQFNNDFRKPIEKVLKKAKLNWEWLQCSNNELPDNVAYINFLQTKDVLLIPQLNRAEDEIAFAELSKFFPTYAKEGRIKMINAIAIAKFGGALNCISWTIQE